MRYRCLAEEVSRTCRFVRDELKDLRSGPNANLFFAERISLYSALVSRCQRSAFTPITNSHSISDNSPTAAVT